MKNSEYLRINSNKSKNANNSVYFRKIPNKRNPTPKG